jgi:hypothetical protein
MLTLRRKWRRSKNRRCALEAEAGETYRTIALLYDDPGSCGRASCRCRSEQAPDQYTYASFAAAT